MVVIKPKKNLLGNLEDKDSWLANIGTGEENAATDDSNKNQSIDNEKGVSESDDSVVGVPKEEEEASSPKVEKHIGNSETELTPIVSEGHFSLQSKRQFKGTLPFHDSVEVAARAPE